MKIKAKKKIYIGLLCFLMLLCCGFALFFTGTSNSMTASAATSYTAKYKTVGTYSTGGAYSSGCPSNFGIYMHSSSTNGNNYSLSNDSVLNWNYVYIKIEVSQLSNHSSFTLTRYGSTYTSRSLSGNSNMTLYSGSLSDGDYELTYVGNYKKNIFTGTTTFTYKYRFSIDKTGPNYTLKAGSTNISSGSYTNQAITYSVSDARRNWRIAYKRPGSSSYNFSYTNSYTVSSTSSNNGWWYFYGEDWYDNTNSTVSVYLDTVKPTGRIYSNGSTVSNGAYISKPFYFTASDSGSGISYLQYKYPGASSWYGYGSGSTLSGSYGWYSFRAIDRAGNVSDEYKVFYDASVPVGTLKSNGSTISSGATVSKSFSYSVTDSGSGARYVYYRTPNSSSYQTYTSGTIIPASAGDGWYYFYAVDYANNVSSTLK